MDLVGDDSLYEIRSAGLGKGMGVFALQDIKAGKKGLRSFTFQNKIYFSTNFTIPFLCKDFYKYRYRLN